MLSLALLIASWGIWRPYSYWLDELCSVTAAQADWMSLLYQHLLIDVHPPLYSIVLKVWMALVGDSEPAVRLLSWSFALSALALAFCHFRQVSGKGLAAWLVLLIASNTYFASHAQEARSYALLLLLSTWSLIDLQRAYSRVVTIPGLMVCMRLLLLSLTHYFGFILMGWLLVAHALTARWAWPVLWRLTSVGLLALIWPAWHVLSGNLLRLGGGNFWIASSGPLDTLVHAQSFLPGVMALLGRPAWAWLVPVGLLLLFAFAVRAMWQDRARHDMASFAGLVMLVLVGCMISVMLVDLRSPISTGRNFVILIPFEAWLLSWLVMRNASVMGRLLLLTLVCGGLLQGGWMLWRNKQSEPENYRLVSDQLAAVVAASKHGVVTIWRYDEIVCQGESLLWREEVEAYYLGRHREVSPMRWRSTCRLPIPTSGDILLIRSPANVLGQAVMQGWQTKVILHSKSGLPNVVILSGP